MRLQLAVPDHAYDFRDPVEVTRRENKARSGNLLAKTHDGVQDRFFIPRPGRPKHHESRVFLTVLISPRRESVELQVSRDMDSGRRNTQFF